MEIRNIKHPEALKIGDIVLYQADDAVIHLTRIIEFNVYKNYPGVKLQQGNNSKKVYQKKLRTMGNPKICQLIIR
jgi:hypothetical protein